PFLKTWVHGGVLSCAYIKRFLLLHRLQLVRHVLITPRARAATANDQPHNQRSKGCAEEQAGYEHDDVDHAWAPLIVSGDGSGYCGTAGRRWLARVRSA